MATMIENDKGIVKACTAITAAVSRLKGKTSIDRKAIAFRLREAADEVEADRTDVPKGSPRAPKKKKIRKGETVSFVDEETDETVQGHVRSLKKSGLLTVEYDGEEYEMDVSEATLVEGD